MDLAKIIRLVAVAFAVIAGVVAIPESAMIVAILGLVGGYFVEEDRRLPFMVATLTLALVHGALGPILFIGPYLTDILGSLSALFSAASCTVIVVTIIERLKP
jgi:hypothetical protein